MNSFLILIYTYKNSFFKIKYLKDSWLKKLKENNIPYFFVTGDEFTIDEPLLKIEHNECYEQLPLKTYLALKESLQYNYNYVIKADSDIFLNIDKLLKLDLTGINYLGKENSPNNNSDTHFYKCKNKEYCQPKLKTKYPYAQGGFYILSRNAVEIIVKYPNEFFVNRPSAYKGEDVLVGEILHTNNIRLTNFTDPAGSKIKMDITRDGLSLHPVHFTLLSKINNLDFEDQIKILQQTPYLNEYNKKNIFDNYKK
jgi:hypothetical protein